MLDFSTIETSKKDMSRGLRFPDKISNYLAEDIGIMTGDGNIGIDKKPHATDYQIGVTGNLISDYHYLKDHVRNLKYSLFGLNFGFYLRPPIHVCYLRAYSKGLVNYYHKICGLPIGPKKEIGIPDIIKDAAYSKKAYFLRGLGDTDFSFCFKSRGNRKYYYPVIKFATASKNLLLDSKELLEELRFHPNVYLDLQNIHPKTKKPFVSHQLFIPGAKGYEKWCSDIGFSNPKNILKSFLWNHIGFCFSSTVIERVMSPAGNPSLLERVQECI